MGTVAEDVALNIRRYDEQHERAVDKWSSMNVRVNAWIGGQDPANILGAIAEMDERSKRWKARGAALAAGKPLDLGTGKHDTYAQWIDFGHTLQTDMAETADDAVNDEITANIETVAKAEVETIGGAVVDVASTLNTVGAWVARNRTLVLIVLVPLALLWLATQVGLVSLFSRRKT